MAMSEEETERMMIVAWFWRIMGIGVAITVVSLAGCPQYDVYSQRLHGEAILAKAHSERQVLVTQAEAERDAAKMRAEAIGIVGKAAKEYPEYRQQEFIGAFAEALHNGKAQQIIYVPTEANIPIIEARAGLHSREAK